MPIDPMERSVFSSLELDENRLKDQEQELDEYAATGGHVTHKKRRNIYGYVKNELRKLITLITRGAEIDVEEILIDGLIVGIIFLYYCTTVYLQLLQQQFVSLDPNSGSCS